jgi:hypothetical protein
MYMRPIYIGHTLCIFSYFIYKITILIEKLVNKYELVRKKKITKFKQIIKLDNKSELMKGTELEYSSLDSAHLNYYPNYLLYN